MGFETIHETRLGDAVEILKSGIDSVADTLAKPSDVARASSLNKYTKGLILVFPVLASKSNHIDSVGIVAKAIESKAVTLLQLALSAANIASDKDFKSGLEYLQQFHTNLDYGKFDKMSVDDFINIMDNVIGESVVNAEAYAQFRMVTDDLRNLCHYFSEDAYIRPLDDYAVMKNSYNESYTVVVNEANKRKKEIDSEMDLKVDQLKRVGQYDTMYGQNNTAGSQTRDMYKTQASMQNAKTQKVKAAYDIADQEEKRRLERDKFAYQTKEDERRRQQQGREYSNKLKQQEYEKERDSKLDAERRKYQDRDYANKLKQQEYERERDAKMDEERQRMARLDALRNNLLSNDVKKANELTPTMMIINFKYKDTRTNNIVDQQMVIGVKAKIYEIEPADMLNKVITKHIDSNILLKLVKVSTREISFVKDFLLAVNSAKLDALSKSKRGSTNKLFKVLERRSLKGKIGRTLKMKDYYKAISTLVISQEEAEELLKNNIDVLNPSIIRPIMEKLNIMAFVIIDESSESTKFIFDTGDDTYETIPFAQLEREQKDGMSRKVINLIAKMNR